jgi:hypothetical protein
VPSLVVLWGGASWLYVLYLDVVVDLHMVGYWFWRSEKATAFQKGVGRRWRAGSGAPLPGEGGGLCSSVTSLRRMERAASRPKRTRRPSVSRSELSAHSDPIRALVIDVSLVLLCRLCRMCQPVEEMPGMLDLGDDPGLTSAFRNKTTEAQMFEAGRRWRGV